MCPHCIGKLENIKSFVDLAIENNEHLKFTLQKYKEEINLDNFNDTKFEVSEEESIEDENVTSQSDDMKDVSDYVQDESSDEDIIKVENERIDTHQFHCKICKNLFIRAEDLQEHRQNNEECTIKCDTCNVMFDSVKELKKHRLETECKVEQHKCKFCNKVFKGKISLQRHAITHTSGKKHACNLCEKTFKFSQNLRRHFNIVHKGLRPFKCDICGKGERFFIIYSLFWLVVFKSNLLLLYWITF